LKKTARVALKSIYCFWTGLITVLIGVGVADIAKKPALGIGIIAIGLIAIALHSLSERWAGRLIPASIIIEESPSERSNT
jgi:hypothetical protein